MGRVSRANLAAAVYEDDSTVAQPTRGPIVRRLTSDLAAERIRDLIFDGTLRPGDRVDQEQLAEDLGISRLPVREAVRSMAQDGLLILAPHAGAFVAEFDESTLRDHFEIIGLIWGLAGGRVARQQDPDVLATLEELARRVQVENDVQRAWDLSWDFQRALNRAGASARQRAVLHSLFRMLPSGFFIHMPDGAEAERAGVQRIWHSIMTGDPEAVSRATVEVLRDRAEVAIAALRDRGVLAPGHAAD